MPERLEGARSQLENLNKQAEAARLELIKPFEQEAELAEKEARLALLNADLNIDGAGGFDVMNDIENLDAASDNSNDELEAEAGSDDYSGESDRDDDAQGADDCAPVYSGCGYDGVSDGPGTNPYDTAHGGRGYGDVSGAYDCAHEQNGCNYGDEPKGEACGGDKVDYAHTGVARPDCGYAAPRTPQTANAKPKPSILEGIRSFDSEKQNSAQFGAKPKERNI